MVSLCLALGGKSCSLVPLGWALPWIFARSDKMDQSGPIEQDRGARRKNWSVSGPPKETTPDPIGGAPLVEFLAQFWLNPFSIPGPILTIPLRKP